MVGHRLRILGKCPSSEAWDVKDHLKEKQLSVIESHICTLELQNKNLLSQLEKLQRRNSAVQEEANQGEPKQTLTLASGMKK